MMLLSGPSVIETNCVRPFPNCGSEIVAFPRPVRDNAGRRVRTWECHDLDSYAVEAEAHVAADVSQSVLPAHGDGNWRGNSDWPVDVLAIPYQILAARMQKVGGDWQVFRGLVL